MKMIRELALQLVLISTLSLLEIFLLDLINWESLDAIMKISQLIASMRENEELHSLQGLI